MQQDNYGKVAKLLHWSIALLIIMNYILGLTLSSDNLYTLHKQTGLTILVLVIIRIFWRIYSKYPAQLSTLTPFEKFASVSVHHLLYVLMLTIPIAGILLTQSNGYPLSLWGIFTIPTIISKQPMSTIITIDKVHVWAAHAIIILAGLHVLAALKHQFINKDRVLQRMLPFARNK